MLKNIDTKSTCEGKMKETGMIRKIDNLGRIVIPKEIRNSIGLSEGSALSISVLDDQIILSRYDTIKSIADVATQLCEVLYESIKNPIIFTSTTMPVCVIGVSKKQYINKPLSTEVTSLIRDSKNYIASVVEKTTLIPIVIDEEIKYDGQVLFPVICDGKCEGMLISLGALSQSDIKVIQTFASFAGKQVRL